MPIASHDGVLDVRFEDLQPDTKAKVLTRAAQLCDKEDEILELTGDVSCVKNGCAMHAARSAGAAAGLCPYIGAAMDEMKTLARQWVDNL